MALGVGTVSGPPLSPWQVSMPPLTRSPAHSITAGAKRVVDVAAVGVGDERERRQLLQVDG